MSQEPDFRPVRSADRTLDLLELLAVHKEGVSFNDIARTLNLPKSSLSGLLRTLTARRYITKTADNKHFRLGMKVLELSSSYLQDGNILETASQAMRRLSAETGETAFVAVLDGKEVIYLSAEYSNHSIRLELPLGQRLPAHATAAGKSLLATLAESEVEQLLGNNLVARTANTINSRTELNRELSHIRRLGYAYEAEEFEIGMHCIAAPIFNRAGKALVTVGVAIPTTRMKEAGSSGIPEMLLGAANEANLGQSWLVRTWQPGKIKIAWSMATLRNQSYQVIYRTVENLRNQYNADVIWADARANANKQAVDVASLLVLKPDVIIIQPEHALLADPLFGEASKLGIPAIDFQRPVRSRNFDFFIGGNTYEQGRRLTSFVAKTLGGKGNLAMIEGDPYNDNARNLAQGVYDELRLFPELKLLADQPCPGWSRELAGELAKTMLQDFGNQLDALIVANDDMAGAVTEVLQAEQLAGKILLVGGDGDLDALERIRTGVQHGTTFQNWINLAEETLRFAIEVARGQVNHTQFKRESIFFNPPGPAVYVKHLPYIFIDRSNLDILENFWVEAMRKAMPDLLPDLAKTVRVTRGV